ncbi:unnamed protein product [Rhizophagus irregularis]|uniref:Uncharacterized protein n=1 Tax=Rhizophagus irregularis TaxID=588596 RepID=A0A915ZRM6_9GLOM|nr:unnamed protein product [Rhizophagus irregularis]CAB5179737.1 unnamed protein product [Rhizophagus irregularis]CAB5388506.1 unnamed protein product [Rhizophagus irregularis]
MSYTIPYKSINDLEGKLLKCKNSWSSFDNNLQRLLEERVQLFKEMKEELESVAYDNNLEKWIQHLAKLDDILGQIFSMFKRQTNHVKDVMPIMEELVKSVKQLQEELVEVKTRLRRLELLSKYRDWITRLRSIMVRKMNERNKKFNIINQEFKNWVEVAEMLLVEADTKVLYEENGEHYEQTCTNLLVNVLKDFDLTKSDFDQLLLMYDGSISGFPNKKTTLADLPYAQVELAGTTFPESMADYKKLLEKALNAIGIWKKEFVIKK